MKIDAFKKIRNLFYYLEYGAEFNDWEVDGLVAVFDAFFWEKLLTPFKDEINKNLLFLKSKEEKIAFLNYILNDSPVYLRDQSFLAEREYVTDSKTSYSGVYNTEYLLITRSVWNDVINVLKYCCKAHGIQFEEFPDNPLMLKIPFPKDNDLQPIDIGIAVDLSNSKGTEKIIYLKELGILDFLKEKQPFNTSINRLATILSAISGEKVTTLQSYINPMYNKDTDGKNNPYNVKENVDKVKSQLINIGFQPK